MTLIKVTGLLLLLIRVLPAQYDRFGAPACSGSDREFADRVYFAICHSNSRKGPVWVG